MIQLVGIEKRFGPKLLFGSLGWHIRRGERVGLVGPNGAGKSTLLKIICGHIEPDDGHVVFSRGIGVGLLAQEQEFTGDLTVLDEVRQGGGELEAVQAELATTEATLGDEQGALERYGQLQARFEALGGYTAEAEAKQVLCGLGFTDEELSQPANRFSGGWRMRISLARLLLTAPDVLLLDEPTNHLDLESLVWLESHLAHYEGAVVVVSHDRYFLNRVSDRIAELTPRGIELYSGDYDKFVTEREARRELLVKKYDQQQQEIAKTKQFIERFRYKNTKAAAVQSRIKMLEKLELIEVPPSARSMRGFGFPQPARSGRFTVELEGLKKSWDDNVVYDGLDLTIERGWKVALVGVNGAGKSTLLKLLAGSTDLTGGKLQLGHNVKVGHFAQHQLESLDLDSTVLAEMERAADVETYPMVRTLLGAFLFSGEDVEKNVGVLSGGEKARLALARLLLHPVALLLMDEPTSHLDLESRASLEDALRRYEGTLVVVSHDRYFMNAVCNRVLEVDRGKVAWYLGSYDDYQWKKSEESAEQAAAGTTEVAVRTSSGLKAKVAQTGQREDDRRRKRRQAQERQAIYKATKVLKAELETLQTTLETAEERMGQIDESLADPNTYSSGEAPALISERAELDKAVTAHYERWESLESAVEEATEKAVAEVAAALR